MAINQIDIEWEGDEEEEEEEEDVRLRALRKTRQDNAPAVDRHSRSG